jgi:hypothetical protein
MSETPDLPAHPARAALAAVDDALGQLGSANLWSMSESDLLDLRIDLEATRARLESATLAVTREVDGRGAATATGAPSTAAWLRGRLRLHPGAAKAEVELARDLATGMTDTAAALAAGHISRDAAAAVATGLHRLPRGVDPAVRDQAQTYLVTQAREFDPAALARLGNHLIVALDPDGGPALEREEARQADRQYLTMSHAADGSRPLRGQFGPEGGALLDAVLQSLSGPVPRADGSPDPRTPAQRRAEGFLELLGHLVACGDDLPEHGGEPVTLTVTTTADYLTTLTPGTGTGTGADADQWAAPGTDGPCSGRPAGPAATLDDGTPLSPETTRRLGCDAWLVTAILNTDGDVLDIGRMSRIVPRPIRRALVVRDGGCAFPGCGRPARWCHAHHIWFWADGGPTKLSNLVLLCGHHHRVVHHHGWDVDIGPDGHPQFHPPPWIDPHQIPRPAWRPPDLTISD